MKTLLTLCGSLALILAVSGCVKYKQAWTINPDGSGKLVVTLGVDQSKVTEQDDPFANLDDPAEIMNATDDGWVAFTKPEVTVVNGYKYVTFTGYFEDINKVTFSGDGGNGTMVETSYELSDGRFGVKRGMMNQVVSTIANDPNYQQTKVFMASTIQGLELSETYTVPGEVADAEGYTVEGRTASIKITADELLGENPPSIEGLGDNELTITFAPAEWADKDAWTAELEQAKTEWQAIKSGGSDN
ncbi:MAG: hypothetical protein AAGH99_11310 [Planctomycetota bacterium]